MLMPSIFGENLFDDFFGDFPFYYDDRAMKDAEKKLYGDHSPTPSGCCAARHSAILPHPRIGAQGCVLWQSSARGAWI